MCVYVYDGMEYQNAKIIGIIRIILNSVSLEIIYSKKKKKNVYVCDGIETQNVKVRKRE